MARTGGQVGSTLAVGTTTITYTAAGTSERPWVTRSRRSSGSSAQQYGTVSMPQAARFSPVRVPEVKWYDHGWSWGWTATGRFQWHRALHPSGLRCTSSVRLPTNGLNVG